MRLHVSYIYEIFFPNVMSSEDMMILREKKKLYKPKATC